MAYNSDNNLDDLIELTKADRVYSLVIENYDGKGVFSKPPLLYGLSQVTHTFGEDDVHVTTVAQILQQYPNGDQFLECEDEFNLVSKDGVKVKATDTVSKIFKGQTQALLYVQNKTFATCELLEEELKDEPTKRKFNWKKCMLTFFMCWILKLVITFFVVLALRYYQVI